MSNKDSNQGDVERHEPLGISVLISGAGVGGLMTALECWRAGCNVRIFERSTDNVTSGDSFSIAHTAIDQIKTWPWMKKRNDETVRKALIAYHDHTGKRQLGPMEFSELMSDKAAGSKIDRHSRPRFHKMLLEQLSGIGLEVEYGRQVVDYFENAEEGRAGVVFKDDARLEADLVVAADGLRSASTNVVTGEPVAARSSGSAVYRVAYPVSLAMQDPEVAERFKLSEDGRPVLEMWVGPGTTAVFGRGVEEMEFYINHPDTGGAEESWHQKVEPAEVVKYTSSLPGWPEVANRLILTAPADRIVDWRLMWRDPQPTWTSPGGRVLQLGDAAHTFLPSSGSGAGQALEDAVSLATCLLIAGSENVPKATKVHNLLRFERVSCLQAFGVLNLEKGKGENRDIKSRLVQAGRWIFDHDPREYAVRNYDQALNHLETEAPFRNTNIPPGLEYRPWTIDGLLEAQAKGEPTVLDGDWS